jgi:hypothetical protein
MKTMAIKLVTGEELLGRSIADTTDYVIVSHARVVGLHQDQQGRMGVGMTEYLLTNPDAEIKIKRDNIVCQYGMSMEAEKAYLSNTSGISLG